MTSMHMSENSDYEMAWRLQQDENELSKKMNNNEIKVNAISKRQNMSLVDKEWETIDPTPNIYVLFVEFDKMFFSNKLVACEVKWSTKMTLCAGVCCYQGKGRLCSIKLSEPLLKLRPRKDLIETLLHEMIHAYLFVTENNRDRDGHGPEFLKIMNRINQSSGTNITVYHNFHQEVDLYRTHWWLCNGPCRNRKPFYGYVKRSMNRAPSENDKWWNDHQRSCGGTFIKVKEPEDKKSKSSTSNEISSKQNLPSKTITSPKVQSKIDSFFTPKSSPKKLTNISNFVPFTGEGQRLGNAETFDVLSDSDTGLDDFLQNKLKEINDKKRIRDSKIFDSEITFLEEKTVDKKRKSINNKHEPKSKKSTIWLDEVIENDSKTIESTSFNKKQLLCDCPVCGMKIIQEKINEHLDIYCLAVH